MMTLTLMCSSAIADKHSTFGPLNEMKLRVQIQKKDRGHGYASGFREASEIIEEPTSYLWTRLESIDQIFLELGLAIVHLERRLRGSRMIAEDHRCPQP